MILKHSYESLYSLFNRKRVKQMSDVGRPAGSEAKPDSIVPDLVKV